jgi:hypothetical protein
MKRNAISWCAEILHSSFLSVTAQEPSVDI